MEKKVGLPFRESFEKKRKLQGRKQLHTASYDADNGWVKKLERFNYTDLNNLIIKGASLAALLKWFLTSVF